MEILENISLKEFNTFGIDVNARYLVHATTIDELKEALSSEIHPEKFILGGGSNMLLTKDIDALVIHLDIKGITIISETEDSVFIKANAGENWHELVLWCLKNDYGGIENLSLIPGNVGTAPIQNIGAYGVELKDTFVECHVMDLENLEMKTISKEGCAFGYRDSIFKGNAKGQNIITDITLKLTKKHHELHVSYGAIIKELEKRDISEPTIQDVSKSVIAIRESKLPNPKQIGNSGSFFKNPIISIKHYNELIKNFPDLPNYPISESECKVPAGWLIERSGFKGKRFGNYGVHEKQALVLVNYGAANGMNILKLAKLIQTTVRRIFDIPLEIEVNIL